MSRRLDGGDERRGGDERGRRLLLLIGGEPATRGAWFGRRIGEEPRDFDFELVDLPSLIRDEEDRRRLEDWNSSNSSICD